MDRNVAFDSRPIGTRSYSYQIAGHILHWFREHRVSSLDHGCVFRTHAGGSCRTKTLLRAVAWLSPLDFAASDPDRHDCGNALREPLVQITGLNCAIQAAKAESAKQ